MVQETQRSTPGGRLGEQLYDVGVVLAVGVVGFASYFLWSLLFSAFVYAATGSLTQLETLLIGPPALGLGMLSGAIAYLVVSDHDVSFIDLEVPSIRDVLYAVGGLLVLIGIAWGAEIAISYFGVEAAEHGTTQVLETADPIVVLYMIVASFVFIGPGEELLFRNVVQKRLYGSFSGVGAIVVASAVFAAVHFQAYSTGTIALVLTSLAIVFVLSLLLGTVYYLTENLFVPVVVHGAYNAVVFYLNFAQQGAHL